MSRQDIKVYVEELQLIESGSYGDQFLRPYVTEVKGSIIEKIEERFQKSRRFNPATLAGIANQFIVPDYQTRGLIDIPNGWGTRRGRFVLTLEINLGTGDRLRQVVMGFTNSVGFTLSGNVDPNMDFYINNMFMLQERTITGRDGRPERIWVPTQTNDLLSDRDNGGLRGRGDKLFTMRPEDVYSALDSSQTTQLVDDLTDLRTTLSKNAIKSSTSNRLGTRFMAKVLHGRQRSVENNDDFGHSIMDVNARAQGYVSDAYASDDIFLGLLSNIRGTTMTVDNFTMRDLLQIDPEADRRCDPKLLDREAKALTNFREDDVNTLSGGEEWDRIAALIGIAVPAVMVEHGIHNTSFKVHNRGIGGAWEFIPQRAGSLVRGMDVSYQMEQFEDRIIDELMMPITGGNQFDVGVDLHCRAFGEIDFSLYWDGENHGRFIFPCFTNSIQSPIVTDDRRDVQKMSRDFSDLFEHFLPADGIGKGGGGNFNF